jgi:hypothetical protein
MDGITKNAVHLRLEVHSVKPKLSVHKDSPLPPTVFYVEFFVQAVMATSFSLRFLSPPGPVRDIQE